MRSTLIRLLVTTSFILTACTSGSGKTPPESADDPQNTVRSYIAQCASEDSILSRYAFLSEDLVRCITDLESDIEYYTVTLGRDYISPDGDVVMLAGTMYPEKKCGFLFSLFDHGSDWRCDMDTLTMETLRDTGNEAVVEALWYRDQTSKEQNVESDYWGRFFLSKEKGKWVLTGGVDRDDLPQ